MQTAMNKLSAKYVENLKPRAAPYKESDGGGLFVFVSPTGAKSWRLAYRFANKQREIIFGDVSLQKARERRDGARAQIKDGVDPRAAVLEAKAELAATKTFEVWADEWVASLDLVRPPLDQKTLDGKMRNAGYLKAKFGKRYIEEITTHDVVLWLRQIEAEGTLEKRDRARAAGENICDFAVVKDSEHNPFRNSQRMKKKLVKNNATKRPGLTKPDAVIRLFKAVAAPFSRARFGDLVGHAMRFIALTVVRPGEIANAEWADFDFEMARWTISAGKMKMDQEHVVPLSRQAVAVLKEVRKLTGDRKFVFSCSKDQPISDNTLCKRLRDLGFDTSKEHCAHGFRTTFSTLSHQEVDRDDNKVWASDVVEIQLAHLEEDGVKAVYNEVGPLALIAARTKLMQHWADRIDGFAGGSKPSLKLVPKAA